MEHYYRRSLRHKNRFWSLDPFRVFNCKSYFQFLTHFLNTTSFYLDKPIWSPKLPIRLKGYIRLFPLMCGLCVMQIQNQFYIFYHCSMANFLCNSLFGLWWVLGVPCNFRSISLDKFCWFWGKEGSQIIVAVCYIWNCLVYLVGA